MDDFGAAQVGLPQVGGKNFNSTTLEFAKYDLMYAKQLCLMMGGCIGVATKTVNVEVNLRTKEALTTNKQGAASGDFKTSLTKSNSDRYTNFCTRYQIDLFRVNNQSACYGMGSTKNVGYVATIKFTETADTKWSVRVDANFVDGGAINIDGGTDLPMFEGKSAAGTTEQCGEATGTTTKLEFKDHTFTKGTHTITIYGRNKDERGCASVLSVQYKRGDEKEYQVVTAENIAKSLKAQAGAKEFTFFVNKDATLPNCNFGNNTTYKRESSDSANTAEVPAAQSGYTFEKTKSDNGTYSSYMLLKDTYNTTDFKKVNGVSYVDGTVLGKYNNWDKNEPSTTS